MQQFAERLAQIHHQIEQACHIAQRDRLGVNLLAVSKTHPVSSIEAFYQLGQRRFGENYLQEALDKIEQLQHLEIEWHFIGHVQRNKTRHLAEKFAWVHGVDRLIIAERLSGQRPPGSSPLNVCLQVNIDEQDSKDGCAPGEVAELVKHISQLPNIQLRGLMVIPRPDHIEAFEQTRQLFEQVRQYHQYPGQWDTLSMGMSGDLEAAIAAGATIVRIGTALFGTRDYAL